MWVFLVVVRLIVTLTFNTRTQSVDKARPWSTSTVNLMWDVPPADTSPRPAQLSDVHRVVIILIIIRVKPSQAVLPFVSKVRECAGVCEAVTG